MAGNRPGGPRIGKRVSIVLNYENTFSVLFV